MTLPKDVAEAMKRMEGYACVLPGLSPCLPIINAHLLSQDAEIERQKSITNIICDDVSAALLRAGFKDVDGPGEAIDIIRERAELAESRLATADALLRDIKDWDVTGALQADREDTLFAIPLELRVRIEAHLQGAGDE